MEESTKIMLKFIAACVCVAVLVCGLYWYSNYSMNKTFEETKTFINDYLSNGATFTFGPVSLESGVYMFNLTAGQGNNSMTYTSFITTDGKWIFVSGVDVESYKKLVDSQKVEQKKVEMQKSDNPTTELFVMTYCPYGLQAEKGMLPVMKQLPNITVRYVHYFMHGDKEEQETYRQICIREEQPTVFRQYLECFVDKGDADSCAKIVDITKTNDCMKNRAKKYYAEDSKLSEGYGVQGSPTLVINGKETAFSPRSPANALKVICSAYKEQPIECTNKLSEQSPTAGFGTGTATSSDASCG